jgi:HD-GYP domain-containing protein (c-di-GMP phosphodiesterase class II)
VQRTVAKLERALHSTIEVVSTIGELRDPYTHGHEHRVGEIAAAIAIEMGLSADQVEGIRVAGYMHDVGKIAVPAEILAKPARLTPAEFELVKGHVQQSYEILKGVEFPWPVAMAAWQHHERLDGSGYPRGLKGDAIILEARILAVADTVEAMASHRPYRPGLGIERALAEVEAQSGKLFDPLAVGACLRLFREKGYQLPA